MADVKDILGMPRMLGDERPAPKPKQERMKRPEGMSREAFALLDGSHPIAPTIDLSKKKKELKGLKDRRKELSAKGKVGSTGGTCGLERWLSMLTFTAEDLVGPPVQEMPNPVSKVQRALASAKGNVRLITVLKRV